MYWAAEQALRAAYEGGWPPTPDEAVDRYKGAFRKTRDERAEAGTRAHTIAERLADDLPLPADLSEEDEAYADAYLAFWSDHDPVDWKTEVTVADDCCGYAGTADLYCEIDGVSYVVDYKGLALDTPLPTPSGWTTIREVEVGERLLGGDGRPCRVVEKSSVHVRDCYRVTFSDETSIVCDDEHLWEVDKRTGARAKTKVVTTKELARLVAESRATFGIDYTVHDLPAADLLIDPYVLGAWLGDGHHRSGEICKPCPELFEEIGRRGYEVSVDYNRDNDDRCTTRNVYGLVTELRDLGVYGDKHIPMAYMRASRGQRLDLLRGVMDTDGYWNPTRKRCDLRTTDERFANEVRELALSLGFPARTFAVTATGFGKTVPAWTTSFCPRGEEVFIARRPDNYPALDEYTHKRRAIRRVERVPTVHTQCIAVDSPDSTYLCGEQMVATHNTRGSRPEQWKIDKYGLLYESNRAQLAALAYARRTLHRTGHIDPDRETFVYTHGYGSGPEPDKAMGVVLFPDGTYETETVEDLDRWFEVFLGCVKVWNALKGWDA